MADQIVIVRHGETEWSLSRPAHRPHRPAADRARPRAGGGAGAELAGRHRSRWCSAARCAARGRRASWPASATEAEICDDLREWDYGEYEGLTTPQIRASEPDWNLWRDGCPGGETPEQVGARLDAVLARAARGRRRRAGVRPRPLLRVLTARWLRDGGRRRGALRARRRRRSACWATSARPR